MWQYLQFFWTNGENTPPQWLKTINEREWTLHCETTHLMPLTVERRNLGYTIEVDVAMTDADLEAKGVRLCDCGKSEHKMVSVPGGSDGKTRSGS